MSRSSGQSVAAIQKLGKLGQTGHSQFPFIEIGYPCVPRFPSPLRDETFACAVDVNYAPGIRTSATTDWLPNPGTTRVFKATDSLMRVVSFSPLATSIWCPFRCQSEWPPTGRLAEARPRVYWTKVSINTTVRIGHFRKRRCVLPARIPIPTYRQYHRPIDSPEHLASNLSPRAIGQSGDTWKTGLGDHG